MTAGPLLLAAAFGCLATTQLLGPSAAQPPLGRADDGATPPFHLGVTPPDWLVIALPVLAVACGAVAVGLALTGRWRPPARVVMLAGFAAFAVLSLLPPIGSADHLSYAGYGRLVVLGHDPYRTAPADVDDPVVNAVEVPWQQTPSVYGPIATAEQAAASWVAGDDIALTVLLLGLIGAVAFAAAGLVLHRVAADDTARMRAAVLWSANPLLWFELGAGAHLDVLVAALAIGAVAALRRTVLGAGALAGAAASVKVPGALVWAAMIWCRRRARRDMLLLTVGAALVVVPGYLVAGGGMLDQLSRASRLVSYAVPWRLLVDSAHPPRRLVGALALLALVALVWLLLRRGAAPRSPAALAAILAFAYVLTAPYALPWYDALPWVLMAAVTASWRDWALLAHTTVLSLSYLNRAATPMHGVVHALTWDMRTVAAPALLLLLAVTVAVAAARPERVSPGQVGLRPQPRR